jgi:hypothetical protein
MSNTAGSLQVYTHFSGSGVVDASQREPALGVAWVVRWAAAMATLALSAGVLAEFGFALAAEQMLARAARAGVLEATLPRATRRSVEQAVWRRLQGANLSTAALSLTLKQNGMPISGKLLSRSGDQFSITLALPTSAVRPAWIRAITPLQTESQIIVHAERSSRSRQLASRFAGGA